MAEDTDAKVERLRTNAANLRADADLLESAAGELEMHRQRADDLVATVQNLAVLVKDTSTQAQGVVADALALTAEVAVEKGLK